MLKYQDIINKLTIEQKLSLLADFGSLKDLDSEEGFKFINEQAMLVVGNDFPDAESLVNSWNAELISKVADSIANKAKNNGATLVKVPDAKVKASPYADGYSEDPHLASAFTNAFLSCGNRVGISTYISNPYLSQEEVSASDATFNVRAVKEYLLKPVLSVISNGVDAVCVSEMPTVGNYSVANEELRENLDRKTTIIHENASAEDTLNYVCSGGQPCKNGSLSAVKDAYNKYLSFRASFEAGEISLTDVDRSCRHGNALSPEMIDTAVDNILEFSYKCYVKTKKSFAQKPVDNKLYLTAAEESIVLLKNDRKVLPVKKYSNVAVIGDLAEYAQDGQKSFVEYIKSNSYIRCSGYAKGYDDGKKRNDKLIQDACAIAYRSDVIVVAVGYSPEQAIVAKKNRTTKLPASQVALLEKLYNINKKVVAVVYGGINPDMSFDRYCSAVLFAPLTGKCSAEALCNVLSGLVSPCGKVANTCYYDTDNYFLTLKQYKNAKRNKVGTFYGYRHYDTAGLKVKYPFGHGLSYSKFTYSGISVGYGRVSVRVKNTGKMPASEVVQLYFGKKDSALIRPKRELKAFKKVYLPAGRSTLVTFETDKIDLRVYDPQSKSEVVENGTYEVYVGSSVTEAVLSKTVFVTGATIKSDNEKPSDYFQNMSNIRANEYHLDVPMKIPKESAEKKRKFATVVSIVMLCLDVVYLYLHFIGWMPKELYMYIIVGVITALPIMSALIMINNRKRFINKYMEESRKMKKENREKLNIDELNDEVSYELLFEREFAVEEVAFEEEEVTASVSNVAKAKEEVFDKDFTLSALCSELMTFVSERGVAIDPISARALVSGMASSRLLILSSEDRERLNNFIMLLGKYFGKDTVIDEFEKIHLGGDDIISYRDQELDSVVKTNIAQSLTTDNDDAKIRLMSFNDVESAYLKPCLTQVFRYIDAPERELEIFVHSDSEDMRYKMPDNVWFIVTLKEEEKVSDIPRYILDSACVLDLVLREPKQVKRAPVLAKKAVEEQSEILEDENTQTALEEISEEAQEEYPDATPVKEISFRQFIKMVANATKDGELEESLWKRVDKLEDFVSADSTYRIENKLWQRMEKYVSVYLCAGGVPEEALDSVLAHHVILGMIQAVATASIKTDEKFAHTLENIFGEGHVPHSVKAIKATGINV